MPFEHARKPKLGQYRGGHESDDDYENVRQHLDSDTDFC